MVLIIAKKEREQRLLWGRSQVTKHVVQLLWPLDVTAFLTRATAFLGVGCTILQGASHRGFVYDSEDNHMGLISGSSAAPTSGLSRVHFTGGLRNTYSWLWCKHRLLPELIEGQDPRAYQLTCFHCAPTSLCAWTRSTTWKQPLRPLTGPRWGKICWVASIFVCRKDELFWTTKASIAGLHRAQHDPGCTGTERPLQRASQSPTVLPREVARSPGLSATLGFQHTAHRKAGHPGHCSSMQTELQTHKADESVNEYHIRGCKAQQYLPVSFVHSFQSSLLSSLFSFSVQQILK